MIQYISGLFLPDAVATCNEDGCAKLLSKLPGRFEGGMFVRIFWSYPTAKELLGLREIRCHEGGKGKESFPVGADHLAGCKDRSGRRTEDGVNNQRFLLLLKDFGDRGDVGGRSQEAGLYGCHRVAIEESKDLFLKCGRGEVMSAMHFPGCFGYHRADCGNSMHAQEGECLQVGLDPGPGTTV